MSGLCAGLTGPRQSLRLPLAQMPLIDPLAQRIGQQHRAAEADRQIFAIGACADQTAVPQGALQLHGLPEVFPAAPAGLKPCHPGQHAYLRKVGQTKACGQHAPHRK